MVLTVLRRVHLIVTIVIHLLRKVSWTAGARIRARRCLSVRIVSSSTWGIGRLLERLWESRRRGWIDPIIVRLITSSIAVIAAEVELETIAGVHDESR